MMKGKIAIAIIFLMMVSILTVRLPSYSSTEAILESSSNLTIILNEIMFDPVGSEVDGEWIELYNIANVSINITNWTLSDQDGSVDMIFPNITVPSKNYILVHIGKGTNETNFSGGTIEFYMGKIFSMLNNGGDDILLKDYFGNTIDYFSYGLDDYWIDPPPPNFVWNHTNLTAREGYSLACFVNSSNFERIWRESSPTPRLPNDFIFPEPQIRTEEKVLITEIYYNSNIKNEYVKIFNPTNREVNLTGWEITDLEGTISFPNNSTILPNQSIYVVQNATDFILETCLVPDYEYGNSDANIADMVKKFGSLILSNSGDEVILKDNFGRIIDLVIYGESNYTGKGWSGKTVDNVTKGIILKRNFEYGQYFDTNTSQDWFNLREYRLGQSEFPLMSFALEANLTLFTSPDCSFETIEEEVANAKQTIFLSVYTFTSLSLANWLIHALKNRIEVKLLLDGNPVGGITDTQKYIAQQIIENGGQVRLLISDQDLDISGRYRYNHGKFMVVDNSSVLITSENFGFSSIPKSSNYGNRGWGVIVRNSEVAKYFADVFFADWNPNMRDNVEFNPKNQKYSMSNSYFKPYEIEYSGDYIPLLERLDLNEYCEITPIIGPEHSLLADAIIGLINSARNSIYIEQFYISLFWNKPDRSFENLYLQAVIQAAERGCEVKVLLDRSFVDLNDTLPDNSNVVDYLNEHALEHNLFNLQAKLVDLQNLSLRRIHNKGMIVDCRKTLISSFNWNYNSVARNREIGVIIENEKVAEYFTSAFIYDWKVDIIPPVAIAGNDLNKSINSTVYFDGSNSTDNFEIVSYQWDFNGDGIVDSNLSKSNYTYTQPGIYIVTLNVTDSAGNWNIDTCIVNVTRNETTESGTILTTTESKDYWVWGLLAPLVLLMLGIIASRKKRMKKNR